MEGKICGREDLWKGGRNVEEIRLAIEWSEGWMMLRDK